MNKFSFSNKLFLTFIFLIIISAFTSCKNEDKGYQQYYNPMGNNPLFVLPWMKNVVKSYYQKQAVILQYECDNETYYMAKAFFPPIAADSLAVIQCTIYDNLPNEAKILFDSDNINNIDDHENDFYFEFLENSTFQYLLWKNTPKDDILMIPWEFE